MRQIDLSGKTAIVTGSGQGIGLATATSLHQAGANVVINYFDDADGHNKDIADCCNRARRTVPFGSGGCSQSGATDPDVRDGGE